MEATYDQWRHANHIIFSWSQGQAPHRPISRRHAAAIATDDETATDVTGRYAPKLNLHEVTRATKHDERNDPPSIRDRPEPNDKTFCPA
jgi:hypothetical protein